METGCGLIAVDPFDLEMDCCLDVDQPVRPTETIEGDLVVTNHEEIPVKGDLRWYLADADGNHVADVKTQQFKLDSGEVDGYECHFTPDDMDIGDAEANYALRVNAEHVYALEDENPAK